jgi:hypothetical protein
MGVAAIPRSGCPNILQLHDYFEELNGDVFAREKVTVSHGVSTMWSFS